MALHADLVPDVPDDALFDKVLLFHAEYMNKDFVCQEGFDNRGS